MNRRWVVKRADTGWYFQGRGGSGPYDWFGSATIAREFTDLAEARAVAKRNPGCKVYRVPDSGEVTP